jgi:hyperosmotically inducible protein
MKGSSQMIKKTLQMATLGLVLLAEGGVLLAQESASSYATNQANQNRIAEKVRHELVMLPYYGVFDDLAYKVDGNTVTLLGQVTRPTLKSDAGNVVKRIEGVTNVVNDIEVLPLSPMDDRIRRQVYRAVYGGGNLATRYAFQAVPSIHIIVKNGQVTLTGVVINQGDKNIAGIEANGVPGVFSVTNNLRVIPSHG